MKKLFFLLLCALCTGLSAQDGSVDATFNPGTGIDGEVYAIAVQADGKIIVGGEFLHVQGMQRESLVRFNPDGSTDNTYLASLSSTHSSAVFKVLLQPDGKLIIAGAIDNVNGTYRNYLARLNVDGTLDPSFNSQGSGLDQLPRQIALQSNGKLIVAGDFTSFDGTSRNRIARLNADGSLDPSFDPGTGFNTPLGGMGGLIIQSTGKIIVSGDFDTYNGNSVSRIVRLNADGSFDNTFNPGTGFSSGYANEFAEQPDGKIVMVGNFYTYDGQARFNAARLNADGSLDASFDPGWSFNDAVHAVAIQPNGQILVGGIFESYMPNIPSHIARLNTDGSHDTSFNAGPVNGAVYDVTLQSDGKILVGGAFSSIDGTSRPGIARLGQSSAPGCDASTCEGHTLTFTPTSTGQTYAWDFGDGSTSTASNATHAYGSMGTYTVTLQVTDTTTGCTTSSSMTVCVYSAPIATSVVTNERCNASHNGAIDLSVTGGAPGTTYTYAWSDGASTEDRTGLNVDTYAVTVTDGTTGCTTVHSVAITEPADLNATETLTDVSCHGGSNGAIDINVFGGTPPYTYQWGSNTGNAVTEDISGLVTGIYSVNITDANGCGIVATYNIDEPTLLTVSVTNSGNVCAGQSNASVSASPSGGTPGYSYLWSPSNATTQSVSSLGAGTHIVTVTDANGCTANGSTTVGSYPGTPATFTIGQ